MSNQDFRYDLFPSNKQLFLHKHIPRSHHYYVVSEYGHDGFLIEVRQIEEKLKELFESADIKGQLPA